MIVVLDNCEHLVRDVAVVVDRVLATAPDLHLLVTSREPLGVDGEVVRRVESLAVPDADAPSELARTAPAVQLFCARAASASERFVVDATTIAPIVEICRRLDGVPLAIELAAARTSALPPAVIAARLDERLRLLSGGSARAQDRHRTLQAAVSWSHDLRSDEERVVFRRLAVFPASFDLAAAEAVAGLRQAGTVDVVARLVDRSLLQYDPVTGRYRLLETLRQFAAERLGEARDGDDSRARHAAHFLGLCARMAPELRDVRYAKAHSTLTAELDNLRATVEWCCSGQRWPALGAMLVDLWNFLFQLGPAECQGWFDELVAHEAQIEPQQAVDILAEEAWLLGLHAADRARARELADRSIALADRNGLRHSPGAWIGKCHHVVWAPDWESLRGCERGIAVAEDRDDVVALVVTMGERALGHALLGHPAEAEAGIAQTRDRAAASGHPICLQSFALYAGIIHLFGSASGPDFVAAYYAITSNDINVDDTMATFVDIFAGAALVGLHRAEAVDRLARAALRADQRGTNNASELALVLLAVLAAEAGRREDGAMLAGYARANHWTGILESPGYSWISSALNAALHELPDRQVHEAAGARASRRDITTLVRALSTR
jgi:predicted ATPase